MFVRLKIGRYAGEVRDIAAEQARILVAKGLAIDIRDELEPASSEEPVTAAVSADPTPREPEDPKTKSARKRHK